MYKQFHHMFSS